MVSLWLLLGTNIGVSAQNGATFRHLGKREGLSQGSVFAIAQDEAGFMWFGTRDGLNRYDGHDFVPFRSADSAGTGPVGDDIRALAYDSLGGRLWVGTTTGLCAYRPATGRFEHFASFALGRRPVRTVYSEADGKLWVGSAAGLHQYDRQTGQLNAVAVAGLSADYADVNAVLRDRRGRLWLGTEGGLVEVRQEATQLRAVPYQRINERLGTVGKTPARALYQDSEGFLYAATFKNGVFRFDPDQPDAPITSYSEQAADPNQRIVNDNVRALEPDDRGGLWMGTFTGLDRLDLASGTLQHFRHTGLRNDELSDGSIRSLYVDGRGGLWAGTYYGGVNHLDQRYARFRNYVHLPQANSLTANVISSFAEDGRGNLYVGTEGGGLDRLDLATESFSNYAFESADPSSLSGPNVKDVLVDGDRVWVGTFNAGLNLLDPASGRARHFRATDVGPHLSHDNVYTLLKRGDDLWIGTYGGGIDVLHVPTGEFYHYRSSPNQPRDLGSDMVRVLHEDARGGLWVGTDEGLSRVTTDADGRPAAFDLVLPHTTVYCLYSTPDGTIWVGSQGQGLIRYDVDGDEKTRFRKTDGLSGNTVFGILPDERRRLWISTNEGLSRYDPTTGQFANFDHDAGLQTREFNFGAYHRMSTGELLFGGIDGFTRFSPKAIVPNEAVPPVVFTALSQNGRPLTADAHGELAGSPNQLTGLTFDYGTANFSVGFTALDYYSPESNPYRYKLDGIDQEWTEGFGKGLATYTLQQEGTYLLRVQGANADGRYNPTERQMTITVLPPWYRTAWAYLLYALALLGTAFAVYRYVVLRQSLHREHLARERDEELHRGKLAFFTNITHEFRTPLTLIVGPLADLRKRIPQTPELIDRVEGIDRNARRLLDLVNRVLTFRKVASRHGGLHARQLDLVAFVRLATLAFRQAADHQGVELEFSSSVPELTAWADPEKIEIIVANLLNNALKFTPKGGRIAVEVTAVHGDVLMRVVDTGRGIPTALREQVFERFYGSETTSTHVGTGIGLAFTRELVELHGGRIELTDTPGGGATFTVRMPLEDATPGPRSVGSPEPHVADELLADPEAYEEELVELVSQAGLDVTGDPRQRLLIVEDNEEVGDYLATVFEDDYQLAFAKTGVEGIAAANGPNPPHIIVSDVMMPEMDGLEMCQALKLDLATSHIPVLLLTARSGEAARLEGLRTGADDYLAKPFQPEEIRLRVRNVLRTRERAKALFTKVIKVEPSRISTTSPDEQFLVDALAAVERNLDDVNFGVVHLARELNVSRALLFTKMRALTNQTPGSFIKHIRLKQATQLLIESNLNVSEVAYTVGFRDPKYFNKCFREEFGVPPSKYKESVGVTQ